MNGNTIVRSMRQIVTMCRHLIPARSWMILIAIALLAGCSETSLNDEGVGGGSCGAMARLDGRWYFGNGGVRVIPTYGDPLGMAAIPSCEDSHGFRIVAVSIVDIRPQVAFASPQFEDVIFIAEGVDSLPPALQRLRQEPRCAVNEAPITLRGPWLGIVGTDGKTEVDLVPPYDLSMRVDDASAVRYERSFITTHVAADLGHPITREDVRSSLWEGGTLFVMATCLDDQFWAEVVKTSPPI